MQISEQQTSNHSKANPTQITVMPFIINGCVISFASTATNTDEPLNAVKQILMSAYKTQTATV